jgi:hypothetical protein
MPVHDHEEWLQHLTQQVSLSDKSWKTAFILSLALGWSGADRFYLNQPMLGIAKLFTFGGYGVWWVIDIIRISQGNMRDGDRKLVQRRS